MTNIKLEGLGNFFCVIILCKLYLIYFLCFSVEVTVKGPVDEKTGMVMDLVELKKAVEEAIMKPLDHKNIDKDVEYFRNGVVSTTENVTVFIWNQLKNYTKELLHEVKVFETEKNIFSYRGDIL